MAAIALAYMSPVHDHATMQLSKNIRSDGVAIPFKASVHPLPLDLTVLDELCRRYRELCEATVLRDPFPGCRHCDKVRMLAEAYQEFNVRALAHGIESGTMSIRDVFTCIGAGSSRNSRSVALDF